MRTVGSYPLWYTLAIVGFINLAVLAITYALFSKLRSTASFKTSRWKAGGAIAGFIILTGVELHLIDRFSPVYSGPSYKVVNEFYTDLQYRRYAEAWKLLHPTLQAQRWHGSFETFQSGFKDTLNIGLLAILLDRQPSAASEEYVVYYVDEVNSPVIPGLERILNAPIRNFMSCSNSVDELRERLRSEGFDVDAFDNIPMHNLLAADRGERLEWLLEHQPNPNPARKKFADLFPQKQKVQFISAYRVTTQNTDKGWTIIATSPIILEE